ncbi:MAG: hypothetical protein GF364_00115 [Candidatus Lokiarchaeota archaeon]|nr:hypothetical protein [Candidatus Lokiarchaeota archaeon]
MSHDLKIRVCLKCKTYIIIREDYESKKKQEMFESHHREHTLITADYNDINNLECGKVVCEDDDEKIPYKYDKH